MPYVNIPFWSWSTIFFKKKLFRGRKTDFRWFFRTRKLKNRFLKDFWKNTIFNLEPWLLAWIQVVKNTFFDTIIFKTFLFVKNKAIGIFTFIIFDSNQKLWIRTYTRFLDFHDFGHNFLNEFLTEIIAKIVKILKLGVRLKS